MTTTSSVLHSQPGRKKRRPLSGIRRRETREAWLILTPILLYFSIFFLFPVISNFYISFTKWNGIRGAPVWIGLRNYLQYLKPPYPLIIGNTLLFAVFGLVFQNHWLTERITASQLDKCVITGHPIENIKHQVAITR